MVPQPCCLITCKKAVPCDRDADACLLAAVRRSCNTMVEGSHITLTALKVRQE